MKGLEMSETTAVVKCRRHYVTYHGCHTEFQNFIFHSFSFPLHQFNWNYIGAINCSVQNKRLFLLRFVILTVNIVPNGNWPENYIYQHLWRTMDFSSGDTSWDGNFKEDSYMKVVYHNKILALMQCQNIIRIFSKRKFNDMFKKIYYLLIIVNFHLHIYIN